MKRQHIILTILIAYLLIFSPISGAPLQSKDSPEIQVKFTGINHTRARDKDIIQVNLITDLPEGTILDFRVYGLVFYPDKKRVVKPIHSYLIEVGEAGQVPGKIRKFPRALPPAIYIIKVDLAPQQRREIKTSLPREMLGKLLTQKTLVIGSLEDLIKMHQDHFSELKDIYETLAQPDVRADRVHQILEKTARFSLDNYPGLYRLSYKRVTGIGLMLTDLAAKGHLETPAESIPEAANDPGTETLTLREDIDDLIKPAEEDLLNEAVFDFFIILNHGAKDMELTYDEISQLTEPKELWAKEKARFQDGISKFDKYFKGFRKKNNSDKFATPYKNISTYRSLLEKLLETYSSWLKEGATEALEQTLQETLGAMEKLF